MTITRTQARNFARTSCARGKLGNWVIQRTKAGSNNTVDGCGISVQVREYVIPSDPRTAAQRTQRGKMTRAAASWRSISDAQKNTRASAANPPTRRQAYLDYCRFFLD